MVWKLLMWEEELNFNYYEKLSLRKYNRSHSDTYYVVHSRT